MATEFGTSDIIDAIINVADRAVQGRDTSTPAIIAAHNVFSDTFRTYTSVTGLLNDGFATGSAIVRLATGIFGGNSAPRRIIVGKRALTDYRVTPNVFNSAIYTVNLKVNTGASTFTKTFTYTSDSSATAAEIVTGLATLIEADTDINGFVAASNSSNVLVVAPSGGGLVSLGVSTDNLTLSYTSSQNVVDAITALLNETANFAFIVSDTRLQSEIEAIAAWVEANKREYYTSSQEADIYTTSTTDLASDLRNLGYNNTLLFASEDANKAFGEGALVGEIASIQAGRTGLYAASPKTTQTAQSNTQITNALNKNANVYAQRGGIGFFQNGLMVSGRDAKTTRGVLSLESDLEREVFSFIVNQRAIGLDVPYTDAGISQITNTMTTVLRRYVDIGFITSFDIDQPFAAEQLATDRINGHIEIPFTATLSGTIKTVVIRGFLTF